MTQGDHRDPRASRPSTTTPSTSAATAQCQRRGESVTLIAVAPDRGNPLRTPGQTELRWTKRYRPSAESAGRGPQGSIDGNDVVCLDGSEASQSQRYSSPLECGGRRLDTSGSACRRVVHRGLAERAEDQSHRFGRCFRGDGLRCPSPSILIGGALMPRAVRACPAGSSLIGCTIALPAHNRYVWSSIASILQAGAHRDYAGRTPRV